MKANKKFVEEKEAVSAVIGVILMVAITVAIAATVYVYVSGMTGQTGDVKEAASVTVGVSNGNIQITLTDTGTAAAATGYTLAQIRILVNGTALTEGSVTDNGWMIGESLWIAYPGAAITLDDAVSASVLGVGTYAVGVVLADTVIYNSDITVT